MVRVTVPNNNLLEKLQAIANIDVEDFGNIQFVFGYYGAASYFNAVLLPEEAIFNLYFEDTEEFINQL